MPCKHGFGSQIENNMLENHTDQREMVLLHYFFYVVASKQGDHKLSDFSSAPDYSTNPKKKTSCVISCIYFCCFAGTLA